MIDIYNGFYEYIQVLSSVLNLVSQHLLFFIGWMLGTYFIFGLFYFTVRDSLRLYRFIVKSLNK